MSVSVVAAGANTGLQAFAANLLSKVKVNATPASTAVNNAVVIGSESPNGAHTCVTTSAGATGAYAGVNAVVVRAVLPKGDGMSLALRDSVDALSSTGINAEAEFGQAKASFVESAKVAAEQARAAGTKKVTILVKEQAKFEKMNEIFAEAAKEVFEGAGIASEVASTAQGTNNLLMFPETAGVVFTADTNTAENIELAFAGAIGGVARTYHLGGNGTAAAGHSTTTVAKACAQSLKALGLTAEASKIEAAAAKGKADGGASILAAL